MIQIKLSEDDDDDADGGVEIAHQKRKETPTTLEVTATGILSSRTPASRSGVSVSTQLDNGKNVRREDLLTRAKKDAAKRELYSRFCRGEVIKVDDSEVDVPEPMMKKVKNDSEKTDEKKRRKEERKQRREDRRKRKKSESEKRGSSKRRKVE